MTSVVGVLCEDGVVIGTDSSATFGVSSHFKTIEQPTEKISIINQVIVAGTGSIGFDQRFCALVKEAWGHDVFKNPAINIGKGLSRAMIEDFKHTHCNPGGYGSLVAFPSVEGFQLCEFAVETFQPEFMSERIWYCSMGSAQHITDPFLAFIRGVFWKEGQPNLHEGAFAVTWTLDLAVDINPGGVNAPIYLATLRKLQDGTFEARNLRGDELFQHRQLIQEAKDLLIKWRDDHADIEDKDIPEIPKPD